MMINAANTGGGCSRTALERPLLSDIKRSVNARCSRRLDSEKPRDFEDDGAVKSTRSANGVE